MEECYVSARTVAERYGVTVQTVWNWVKSRKIPAYKIGRNYRFKLSELPKEIK